jgi:hypothetical protein
MKANEKTDKRPGLKLIQGGLHREMRLGSVRIVAAPEDKPPFRVDAVVAEEDTFLVLSADPEVREPDEHPVRLFTRIIETLPEAPGNVLVKEKSPLKFLAIVHDLNQEPSWKEEWIAGALEGILQEAERRKLRLIALPLLGTLHGNLKKGRFAVLLRHALGRATLKHLECIWLVMPTGTSAKILEGLRSVLEE